MITADELRRYARAWQEGAHRLHELLPEGMKEWTGDLYDAFIRILDFINAHADTIEQAAKVIELIATYLSARQIFGSTEDGEGSALPAEALAIQAECDLVRAHLAA